MLNFLYSKTNMSKVKIKMEMFYFIDNGKILIYLEFKKMLEINKKTAEPFSTKLGNNQV